MTCQHCQTWILDDDHRCRRCGRRVRVTPSRISAQTYPVAATATAPAYDFAAEAHALESQPQASRVTEAGQQTLFSSAPVDPRVIPFDSLTTAAERESIRARAAEIARPAPIKNGKVELRHARAKRVSSGEQRHLDFFGENVIPSQPQSHIICDAPVAPPALRVQAALIDGLLIACGCLAALALYLYQGGTLLPGKHGTPFLLAALATVPAVYKLIFTAAGRDTIGMQTAGLYLVDFDGNPPSRERRYQRTFGSVISLLAAGIGLVWALVDEDNLTWHDHMSNTFPTVASEADR
jgi:uncharacterized RDD family membrane protein YckC